MGRRKVYLAFVTNDAARKMKFKNRRRSLMKKVAELNTLCGVETCAVVFSPYEPEPDVWPNVAGAQHIISQFRRLPEIEQTRKMINRDDFTRQSIVKATELLRKTRVDNHVKELTGVIDKCLLTGEKIEGMNLSDLTDMCKIVDQDLKKLKKIMEEITPKDSNNMQQQQLLVPPAAAPPLPALSFQPSVEVVPGPMSRNLPPIFGMGIDNHQSNTQYLIASPPLPHPPPVAVVPGPMLENQPPSMENGEAMPQWAIEWMNNPTDQKPSFGNGLDETTIPFPNNSNWPDHFFPWL